MLSFVLNSDLKDFKSPKKKRIIDGKVKAPLYKYTYMFMMGVPQIQGIAMTLPFPIGMLIPGDGLARDPRAAIVSHAHLECCLRESLI